MIGFLSGIVHSKSTHEVIVLVNGVGYQVAVPPTILGSLQLQQKIELYIHTNVKEDALDLYGFKSPSELSFFKLILGVSGIGPKTALLVIDRGVEPLRAAIVKADTEFFTTIPRLGQKNAQRIIIDLKNKLGSVAELDLSSTNSDATEMIEALQSMGYSKQEAMAVMKNIPDTELSLEQRMTLALRQIGKTKLK